MQVLQRSGSGSTVTSVDLDELNEMTAGFGKQMTAEICQCHSLRDSILLGSMLILPAYKALTTCIHGDIAQVMLLMKGTAGYTHESVTSLAIQAIGCQTFCTLSEKITVLAHL